MQKRSVEDALKAFAAKLPATEASKGRGPNVPPGMHQVVLKGFPIRTRDVDGRPVPYAHWIFEVLSSEGVGEKYKGRRHTEYQGFEDDERDRKKFKTLATNLGLPDALKNDPAALRDAIEDPKEFVRIHGALPMVEAKLVQGKQKNKRGEYPIFFNFVRRIEREEVGLYDTETTESKDVELPPETPEEVEKAEQSQETTEDVDEEEVVRAFPTPKEIRDGDFSAKESRDLLQTIGVAADYLVSAKDTVILDAAVIVAALRADEDPEPKPEAMNLLLEAFGIKADGKKNIQRALYRAILQALETISAA